MACLHNGRRINKDKWSNTINTQPPEWASGGALRTLLTIPTHTASQSAGAGVHWLWHQSQLPAVPTLQDMAPPPTWEMRILLLAGVSGVNQQMGDLLCLSVFKWTKVSNNSKLCTSSLFQNSNSATATRYLSYVSCVGIFRWVLTTLP